MHTNEHELSIDNPPPLHLGPLKIDEQRQLQLRRLQVVDALRQMLVRETLDTLQLDKQLIFNKQICKILAHRLLLIGNGKGNLRSYPQSAQNKFPGQSPLIYLFEESTSKHIGNFIC